MPIYQVTTPTGLRVIEAVSQKDAVEHVVTGEYKASALSSVQLSHMFRAGHTVDVTEKAIAANKETAPDPTQMNIDSHISKADDSDEAPF